MRKSIFKLLVCSMFLSLAFQANSQKLTFVNWNDFISYPLHSGINVQDNAIPQWQAAGATGFVNCHGYAWGIAIGFYNSEGDYDFESLPVPMGMPQCDPEDATHIIYYRPGDNPISKPQHSAIISMFNCFPYEDGWVQSKNGPSPALVLHKIDDYGAGVFNKAYYDMRNNGQLPFPVWVLEHSTCPAYCYAIELGPIVGSGVLPPNTNRQYSVDFNSDFDYVWSQGGSMPSAAFRITQNPFYPNKCTVKSLLPGEYVLQLDVKQNGNILATYTKNIFVPRDVIKPSFSVSPNPTTGHMVLTSEEAVERAAEYVITDYYGQIRMKGILKGERKSINVSSLKTGVYYMKIINGENVENLKFVKK